MSFHRTGSSDTLRLSENSEPADMHVLRKHVARVIHKLDIEGLLLKFAADKSSP